MTNLSSTPRGEHTPRPGVTWEISLASTGEHVVPDDAPTPQANRATRRAAARPRGQVTASEALRTQLRDAVRDSGRKQVWIAKRLGITEKHLSQMLTGRAVLPLDRAQQIADLCDARVRVSVTRRKGR